MGGGGNVLMGQTPVMWFDSIPAPVSNYTLDSPLEIFDDFGNSYSLDDVAQPSNRMQLLPCDFDAGMINGANFNFQVDFYDPVGFGFNAGTPAAAAARDVVCQVLTDLSFMLDASPICDDNPPTLRIQILPSFYSWSTTSYTLGRASGYYYNFSTPNATKPGITHNSVWRTINGGEDPTSYPYVIGDFSYHGYMEFNFHENINWNFDMNDITWVNSFNFPDFYQVVLHEVMHMLGISSLINNDGNSKWQPVAGYDPPGTGLYTRYDKYLNDLGDPGLPLIVNNDNCYETVFNQPIACLTAGCDRIRFQGPFTPFADLSVYSPVAWAEGSSISHFGKDIYQTGSECDAIPYLMTPAIVNSTAGFAIRRPTDFEVEALCAIGYRVEGGYGDGTLPFHSAQNEIYLPACGHIAAGVDDDGLNCHDGFHFSACDFPFTILISDVLANDRGVQSTLDPACIDAIVGAITYTANTTSISIIDASLGFNVLSYIPISAATGEEANTTFIYFFVEHCLLNCTYTQPCDVVCNSTFIYDCPINNIPQFTLPTASGLTSDLNNCATFDGWRSCFGTPNFVLQTTLPNLDFPSPGSSIGMWSNINGAEALIGMADITAGQRYILSFHRAVTPLFNVLYGGSTLDNLYVHLLNEATAPCNNSFNIPNVIPNSQNIYTETNLPPQGWQQAINCFTADDDYDAILIHGRQNTDSSPYPYYLIDNVSIMPDTFFAGDTTISVSCCNSAILTGDSCNVIPNVFYTWELQNAATQDWEILEGETDPFLVSEPACDTCWHYRLIRNILTEETEFPVTGNFTCLTDTAHFTVCGQCCPPIAIEEINSNSTLQCCLDTIGFALQPGMPQVTNNATTDNRPAYVVPANATWTPTSNDFVTLGLVASGDPVLLDVDIVVPAGVTLFLQDMRMIFSPNTRIIVKRGARLSLNSSQFQTHLSGLCNSVWQGIQVEGPGLGIQRGFDSGTGFNNFGTVIATVQVLIEDAIIGIATQNLPIMDVYGISLVFNNNAVFNPQNSTAYPTLTAVLLTDYLNEASALATAGGVCIVADERVTFLNCFHGINLSWFNNSFNGQPRSEVLRASFISDGLKYPFSNFFTQPRTEAGVYMQNYRSVEIGETASSAGNIFAGLKYGIRAEECTRVAIYNNQFDACTVGISAATASIYPLASQYTVVNNQINNSRVAMQFSGTSMDVLQNSINTAPSSVGIIGIFARGCLFNIENQNTINSNTFGCILMNTGLLPNRIRNNDFNSNAIGIWAFGNNGIINAGGVQITCNRFDNGAVAIATQDYVVSGTVLTVGSLDNQGDCLFVNQNPADNVFNQNPGAIGFVTDIVASQTGGTFTYFHRADIPLVAQFTPSITGNVTNSQCTTPPDSPEENCGNRDLLEDEEIRGIEELSLLNFEMLRKSRHYEEEGDTTAAVNLLESVNNEFAQRLLLQKYMEQDDSAIVNATLAALPAATEDQQHFQRIAEIQWSLKSQNRIYLQLTPQEETDLRNIATAYSPSAHHAQTMLLIAHGEEYPCLLPDFPAFLDTALFNQIIGEGINFKNKPTTSDMSIGLLYPNPAQNFVYLQYSLPQESHAVFSLYDAVGRVLYVSNLQNSGQMQYAVEHLPNGIYFYHIAVNGKPWSYHKLVLVR